jgi:septal ring factor EnvC (AmiA/AmiB activator)
MNQMKQMVLFAAIFLIFPATCIFSQETPQDKPFQEKGTIESQFKYIYDQSYTFEIYKSVRISWFQTLKSHVLDTLKSIKKELKSSQKLVEAKDVQMDSLKSELEKTKQNLATTTKEKNSFELLGILMGKNAYNSIVWLIILGLAGLLLFFVLLFKRSNSVTSQTKKDLSEIKEEFETFRKRSLEREEKMARKHLDELNKYKK